MKNTINSGSLQGLQAGQTLLLQARKVNGGKIQLEFAEIVQTQSNAVNPLSLFNKSDDRFSQGNGARRAWLTAEAKDASNYLGIDLTSSDWTINDLGQEVLILNVLNPVANINGEIKALKVEIIETTTPTDWQAANISTAAKRRGKNGSFITYKGMYIFTNSRVVFDKATHVFLEADAAPASTTASGIPANVDLSTGEIFS
jgi:hypothetical protein